MDPNFINPIPNMEVTGKPANLYIIFVDHGLNEVFYIYPEMITSSDLKRWLGMLQNGLIGQAKNQEIVVILGYCQAGSFIDDLSGENRVIVTSAASGESSYKGPLDEDGIRDGEYFVTEFFGGIALGKSVKECFEGAVARTETFVSMDAKSPNAPHYDTSLQHPLLDDNGDKLGSNDLSDPAGDGLLSTDLFIGVSSITGNDPGDVSVNQVAETLFLDSDQDTADLWARVNDNNRLGTIWVEIKPPGFEPVGAGGSGQVEMTLQKTVYENYNPVADQYEWDDLEGFTEPGAYQVLYFAKDDITGNISPLMETRIYKRMDGNEAPNPFSLVSPADNLEVFTTVILDWESTTDPEGNGITYTVLLSRNDPSFGNPIRKEGLLYSTCLIDPSDGMVDLSDYYWRVQAIDEYGAIRESEVKVFHTNNTNLASAWVKGHIFDAGTSDSIAGASVAYGSQVFNTEESGGFYLGILAPGTYTITVSSNGYGTKNIPGVVILEGTLVQKDVGLEPEETIGDINNDKKVDLIDAILVLKVLSKQGLSSSIYKEADVDEDDKIGLEEVVYILQEVSGLR
jgi:hypothetical protein